MAFIDSGFEVDKLTSQIFNVLETNFLFGDNNSNRKNNTKVRVLTIDGPSITHGILAATSLSHLESFLRRHSGNSNASVSDYFDIVAGSGVGGILAALLFTSGKNGRPLFTADQALAFLIKNRRKFNHSPEKWTFRSPKKLAGKVFSKTFGDCTLKDTLKSVLIPCYDLSSRSPFVFSRADAVEIDGYDFKMSDVCLATSASFRAVEVMSVDKRTKIVAVDGGVSMNNPTAAAITHVLNNKQEFPLCNGVEDLLVVSLGNGESGFGAQNFDVSSSRLVRIAGEGASDMVDQAVSMAFGPHRTTNYIRIQGNGVMHKMSQSNGKSTDILAAAEEMLRQKNVECVLFQGKKINGSTNLEKLESFVGELVKEEERRRTSIFPAVVLKQKSSSSSPSRTSSATTLSTLSSC